MLYSGKGKKPIPKGLASIKRETIFHFDTSIIYHKTVKKPFDL